jgi:hypothetical protein
MTRRHADPLPALDMAGPEAERLSPSHGALPAGALWTPAERTWVLGLDALGFILVLVGAYGAGGTRDLGSQTPWITVAMAGGGLPVIVHSVGYQLARARIRAASAVILGRVASRPARPVRLAAAPGDQVLVAGPRMRLYHRSDCPFVADKTTRPSSRSGHEAAGLAPCAVCRP